MASCRSLAGEWTLQLRDGDSDHCRVTCFQNQAFISAFVESLRTGLLGVDASAKVVVFSEEGARILCGTSPEHSLGRDLDDVLSHEPALCALLHAVLAGREIPSRSELELHSHEAKERRIGFTVTPVQSNGDMLGAVLLFRDLTPFERMDEQERLRDRLTALGQMAAGMAHEIRNPLASIELLAGLIKRELPEDDELKELVEDLIGEVHVVAETVHTTLDYVRPQMPTYQEVGVLEFLQDVVRRARNLAPAGVEIELHGSADLRVSADPHQLRTLTSHLISNALQLFEGGEHGRVRVSAEVNEEAEFQLVVEDSGPGVRPALRDKIFYPFFTTRAEGTGVGLAEVQKFAVAHGGSVQVLDSDLGGARFVVTLPLQEPQG